MLLRLKASADLSGLPFSGDESVMALDVTKIDNLIVDPLMTASGGPPRELTYDADAQVVMNAVGTGAVGGAVLLNPAGVEQVLAVSDAQAFMPQKSTFFAPKVPSGLVVLGW